MGTGERARSLAPTLGMLEGHSMVIVAVRRNLPKTVRYLLQHRDVGQVLRPSGGALIGQQICECNERNVDTVDFLKHCSRKSGFGVNAIRTTHDIDMKRSNPQKDNLARPQVANIANDRAGGTKTSKGDCGPLKIVTLARDEKV